MITLATNEELLKFLKEYNCGKCRYLCRAYGQCCCCWAGLDKDKALLPDFWFPYVCKNFEPLRKGEDLSNVYDRLKK
jgi:hypothetical protein